jgi:rod shape determining protein RodA
MFRQSRLSMRWRSLIRPWAGMDGWLFWTCVGLIGLGGLMIRSVELNHGWTDWWQHWLTGGIGLVLALAIATIDYTILLEWHWLIYGVACLSLIAVRFVGTAALGAQRWINILGFNVQPSEFGKVALIITLAAVLHHRSARTIPSMLKVLAIAGLPWFLVFIEPNLGTSLVFGAITLGMLYWGNVNPGWLLLLLSAPISAILLNIHPAIFLVWIGVVGVTAWFSLPWPRYGTLAAVAINLVAGELGHILWGVLKDYQKDRVILFLDPEKDPLGGGYHLIQSRIAVGAGQLWGQGLFQGTQTQLNYVPEQHTDFIFTAIGEELGFIGAAFVLVAFWVICYRLVIIAQNSPDRFGGLLAVGMLSMTIFQVMINVGMTIGLSPVTGIPLPWLSYGRSALLASCLMLGLVESVANHRQRSRF